MTGKIWFTADLHFDHVNQAQRRGFDSVGKMNEVLVNGWNEKVCQNDTVYVLGDFTMKGADVAATWLWHLNGTKHLIWGNHDRPGVRKLPQWKTSQYATEISVDGTQITLCHYAMRVWNNMHRGALMLYGHSHNNLTGNSQSLDVGVDAAGYAPMDLGLICYLMKGLPPVVFEDHHKPGFEEEQQ